MNSGSWWWTGRPGTLRFMGSQRVGHDWATELSWTELMLGKIEGRRRRGRQRMKWHRQLDGHGFGWTPGVGDGQGGLVCCGSWGRKESDTIEWLNWTELKQDLYHVNIYFWILTPEVFLIWFILSFPLRPKQQSTLSCTQCLAHVLVHTHTHTLTKKGLCPRLPKIHHFMLAQRNPWC